MPRRELLTPAQRQQLYAFPDNESELIRLATLSKEDMAFVRQHRGEHNRLGIAVLMTYVRFPGRVLGPEEPPHPPILGILASQLHAPAAVWDLYAKRDETRREHLREVLARLSRTQFGVQHHRQVSEKLMPIAIQTANGMVLAEAAVAELRLRGVLLPSVSVIEQLCAAVATRAQREIYRLLIEQLSAKQRASLDELLSLMPGKTVSTLVWLRRPPGEPNAKSVLQHIERLKTVRAVGLPADIGKNIPQNRLLRLAREGAHTAVYQLQEYEVERRHATLVAILLDTAATLTDEILNLHDRIIGSFFTQAKHTYEQRFAADGKAVNDKVRLYVQVGTALIKAKESGGDAFKAIESIMPWETFVASVLEAENLSREAEFDSMALLVDYYSRLHKYAPALLNTFEFHAASAREDLLAAVNALRDMNANDVRKVPESAPVEFIKPRWGRFVFKEDGAIDRKFYEFAVMSELKNALRAGDMSVVGSRQFKDFDEYLMPRQAFLEQLQKGTLGLSVDVSAETYINERLAELRRHFDEAEQLAEARELPDVEISAKGLKISPLEDSVPPAAKRLTQQLYDMLPRVKITDLLLEVDQWTGFTKLFTHLKDDNQLPDRNLLLTAILADGFNLGLEKMAEACPGTSGAKLAWIVAWYIREETYQKALACLINYQHSVPFAAYWGEGTTSSSDGQRYKAGGHGAGSGFRNPKYGEDPGVLFYTHLSDQYGPFYTKVINSPTRDATHVLDGLLYHESELVIEEHYTDTAGFTDHVFGICPFFGFQFAPRIADLPDKNLYTPDKSVEWPELSVLVGGSINRTLIEKQFQDIVRLAASIKQGSVTASLIMRKLASYPRQNGLAMGLRELGRIERTIFTLRWLRDPELRRRNLAGLNKGEARNSLARAVSRMQAQRIFAGIVPHLPLWSSLVQSKENSP